MIERFEKPYIILCEGRGDQRFFERLLAARNIPDQFSVLVPRINEEYAGGRPNFGRYLSSISVDETFADNVRAVLVVSDNDTVPADSFAEVQEQLKIGGLPVPTQEREVSRKPSQPATVVLMLPNGTSGNLETLCLSAAYSKWGLQNELDEFLSKTPARDWTVGKQSKMKIQTILASTNDKQPDSGFAGHWRQPDEYQIPLDHATFDDIVNFLSGFPAMIGV